ncbi:MAG: cyclic nucleotide-binding domain-containing protein [Candidatus Sericytochromatia bacterium]|nr:cyclic nucleotide-binding domain-containing protein [Candidatus Sericytochromatia bacterium]
MSRFLPPEDPVKVELAATDAQRDAIAAFRYDILIAQLKRQLASADHQRRRVVDEEDATGVEAFVSQDGQLVGALRLNRLSDGAVSEDLAKLYALERFSDIPPEHIAVVSRLVVPPGVAGVGDALSDFALRWAIDNGIRLAFSYCSPHLVAPYEQLGFRRYKDNFQDPMGYRVPMVLVLFDLDHLARIHSPLAARLAAVAAGRNDSAFFAERFPEYDLPANPGMYPKGEFWSLLGSRMNVNPLEAIPLFQGLSADEAGAVMKAGTILPLRAGDRLLSAGETGREFYLVLKGMLGVTLPGLSKPVSLLGPGEIVGEMAFLADAPRSADVEVFRDGEVMVLSEESFLRLAGQQPAVASKVSLNLARILGERLAVTSQALAEAQRR